MRVLIAIGEKSSGLRRREFLALGPAIGLAAGMLHLPSLARAMSPGMSPGIAAAGEDLLSIGYWQGSDRPVEASGPSAAVEPQSGEAMRRPIYSEVVPAQALPAGDRRFAQLGARVCIHGLYSAASKQVQDLPGLSIDVQFNPYHQTPFHAWRFDPAVSGGGASGLSFSVPLAKATGLTLGFTIGEFGDRRIGTEASCKRINMRFSLGRELGQPKLRRGVYLIAWRGSVSQSLPSWRRYLIEAAAAGGRDLPETEMALEGESRLIHRGPGRVPAKLAHVRMTVDYAEGAMEWV